MIAATGLPFTISLLCLCAAFVLWVIARPLIDAPDEHEFPE